MVRTLPFAGYSWQISQHEICFDEEPLVGLLGTAALFENRIDYSSDLNSTLAEFSFVTKNMREGTASPWRDYQQVLPEMGLMISTKTLRSIALTDIGRSYLAGSLLHDDLMTLQLLRYQYPNGFKSKSLQAFVNHDVVIRPGLMILRGLIELRRYGIISVSIDQLLTNFLPNRNDQDWELSVEEIQNGSDVRVVNTIVRRNVTAWARLLGKTKLFSWVEGQLRLSDAVIANLDTYAILADHLIIQPKWQPKASGSNALDWFGYYGSFEHVDPQLQTLVEVDGDQIFIIQDGIEIEKASGKLTIDLIEFSPINLTLKALPQGTDELFQSYLDGRAKLRFAKQEHDKLVNAVAKRYSAIGWSVRHDPGSVDLLVKSPQQVSRIIEVKTTTQKTMSKQVRTGVGQVLEYKYRYNRYNNPVERCDIILNRPFGSDDWHREFCSENSIVLDYFGEDGFMYGDI